MSEKDGTNERTIERDLAKLKKLGILTCEGGRKNGGWGVMVKMPMIASKFSTHKRKNVFELLWLFVNTTLTKLMDQLKYVPSMFHQNLEC